MARKREVDAIPLLFLLGGAYALANQAQLAGWILIVLAIYILLKSD